MFDIANKTFGTGVKMQKKTSQQTDMQFSNIFFFQDKNVGGVDSGSKVHARTKCFYLYMHISHPGV